MTVHTINGAEWLIGKNQSPVRLINVISPIRRYAEGIFKKQQSNLSKVLRISQTKQAKDHFGYQKYQTLGEQYSDLFLMNVTKKDRIVYNTVWKAVDRFDSKDFIGLENDIAINRLYDNFEFTWYYITPDIQS